MSKNTTTYWNVLEAGNASKWEPIEGTDGMLQQLTLTMDDVTGDYTRLTRFQAGADTKKFGAKSHDYPEEIYIISGGSMMKLSTCGWKRAISPVGLRVKCMGHLFARKNVWFWKSRIQVSR